MPRRIMPCVLDEFLCVFLFYRNGVVCVKKFARVVLLFLFFLRFVCCFIFVISISIMRVHFVFCVFFFFFRSGVLSTEMCSGKVAAMMT